jgi:hypothetical protein
MTITTLLPDTGYQAPNADELPKLHAIVLRVHPGLNAPMSEFSRAMFAAGCFFRTAAPDRSRYFSTWLDRANEILAQAGSSSIGGGSLLGALIAHADVCWRAENRDAGQMLEVGLNQYRGARCQNSWRDVLAGQPLRPSLPPIDHGFSPGVRYVRAGER